MLKSCFRCNCEYDEHEPACPGCGLSSIPAIIDPNREYDAIDEYLLRNTIEIRPFFEAMKRGSLALIALTLCAYLYFLLDVLGLMNEMVFYVSVAAVLGLLIFYVRKTGITYKVLNYALFYRKTIIAIHTNTVLMLVMLFIGVTRNSYAQSYYLVPHLIFLLVFILNIFRTFYAINRAEMNIYKIVAQIQSDEVT